VRSRRPTKAEREARRYELERSEWSYFFPRLQAAQKYGDAVELVLSAPSHSNPGRKYYSNLGFFMHTFSVPDGSSGSERQEYLRLVRNFDAAGALKEGALAQIEEKFMAAETRATERGW
jgi:hypothetical protein